MPNLFAYGTLMCEEIMQQVAGCLPPSQRANLRGYQRFGVKAAQYPGIIPDAQSDVPGVVYWNVPEQAWRRLDRFEGEMYVRQPVRVELQGLQIIPAETYVVRSDYRHALSDSEWDFERFLERGKTAFQARYAGYREL